jgi:pseudouridine synthase
VKQRGPKSFKIILTQGLNRQIRRMCEELGYEVESLKRVRIMHIQLDLPIGKWRHLTIDELTELRKAAAAFDNKTGLVQPH